MNTDGKIVVKAGIWYAISNILVKATAFLTTPLFTRLLTQEQYGEYSNIASWVTIFTVLTGFDAYTTVIRSKHDFDSDIDTYVSSVYFMNITVTVVIFGIIHVFWDLVNPIFSIEKKYFPIIFLYLLVLPAYNLFMTKQRAYYKYKLFAIFTIITTFLSAIVSVILVLKLDNKLDGRVIGQYAPPFIFYILIALFILVKGHNVKIEYIKYAAIISLPLVPHLLSLNILSSSARIMLKQICSAEMAALYSVDYNCVQIITILFDSVNKAWAPWLMDALHAEEYKQTRKISNIYFGIMMFLCFGVLLIGPEIILILGGESYIKAIWALPPLLVACVFQVAYTMYVNVEFYMKKTISVAIATGIAAVVNIVLNIIFIPQFGFVAASFNTLFSYIVLYLAHYIYLHKIKMAFVFRIKLINLGLVVMVCVIGLTYLTYLFNVIRWILFLIYMIIIFCFIFKYKREILKIIFK